MIRDVDAGLRVLMGGFAADLRADGLTLWMAEGEELVAVANPLERELEGMRQPLSRGLISGVYLSGCGMVEEDLAGHEGHDRTIDQRVGKVCISMMAVAVDLTEMLGGDGVISAVRHEGAGFGFEDLKRLEGFAVELGKGGWR